MPSLKELPVGMRLATALTSRREALRLLAAGIAAGLAGCSKPNEEIVPYVRVPEGMVPGDPLKFATTLPLSGYGRGVIVTAIDGRPIKVEGNPRHPASLGATDVFSEADVLSLYDPDRSRTVLKDGDIASWDQFLQALQSQRRRWTERQGEGLRLLTGRVTSPTLARQIDDLRKQFPKALWHSYASIDDEAGQAGASLAYGRPLDSVPRLDRADIILTLDADPIGHGPDQIRKARGFASHRAPQAAFSRLYAVEAAPTLTGAKADHRLALHPSLMTEAALAVANALGAGLRDAAMPQDAARFLKQAADDLSAHHGAALVLGGRSLPPAAQALVHWINATLSAPVDLIEPVARNGRSLADLVRDCAAGAVDALVIVGANPAYDAPVDLDVTKNFARVPFRLHVGLYADETSGLANWHIPQAHPLEAWSDLRAIDGTASVVQPLIRPLYGARTDHEVLSTLSGRADAKPYDLVRETWNATGKPQAGADFETWWKRALHDGIVADSAAKPVAGLAPQLPPIGPSPQVGTDDAIAIVLRPDPCLWDGSFGNNAWLQECPKPLTKQVWGNALALGADDAKRLTLTTGDVVTVSSGTRRIDVPVSVESGLPKAVAHLSLGLGRRKAGAIGNGIGANAYALRTAAAPWVIADATLKSAGRREDILTTQNVVRTPDDVRELYPLKQLSSLKGGQGASPSPALPSLLPQRPRPDDGYAWAMVIDASVCIGCNACIVACQSENNVPVVGPEEVALGRDMHWLRIDVYDHGTPSAPQPGFQPVPCMQCEHAPCEPVCPVAASVHDGEGLNVQVYNRCIGTRFCEANCPYKVRRFNFRGYSDGEEYANLGLESYRAQKNPEVTVRARGVMEKCTYCVQRISAARRTAEREDRSIGPDEVRTACQNACPTRAISFGDLHQPASAINALKRDPRHYALLEHLGTRPRTTYLADVRNPAPGFDEDRA